MSDRDRLAAVLLAADQAERGGGWTWATASPAKRDQYRRLADRLVAAGVTMPPDVMDDDYVPPCCRPGGRCDRE